MSLSVNAKDDCEKFFTSEALEKLGVDIEERQTLRENLKYNFTAEMACVEHPFDISLGNHSRNKLYFIVHSIQNVLFSGSCEKDSGGPVVKQVIGSARNRPYYEQIFIVSDGFLCKAKATILTRLSNRQILSWIQKTTDTSPLLMVVGGYSSKIINNVNGLLKSVELLTPSGSPYCSTGSRSVASITGRTFIAQGEGG